MYRNGDAHALPSVFHSGCTEEMVCFDGILQAHGYGCVLYELESTAVNNKTNVELMQMIVTESLVHKT